MGDSVAPGSARQGGGERPELLAALLGDRVAVREQQVLEALCHGQSDKEIAKHLDVALGTVRNHVAKIYAKLDVHNRNAALLWARRHGYFSNGGNDEKSV